MHEGQGISRRTFLAGAAGTMMLAGLGGLSACSPKSEDAAGNTSTSELTCDVVVIGSGVSGSLAALVAREKGAEVILVEKESMFGGTSALSTANFMVADTDAGIDNIIAEQMETHKLSPDTKFPDVDRMRAMWKQQKATVDYMVDLGLEAELKPDAEKGTSGGHWKGDGGGLMQACSKLVDSKGVQVELSSPVKEILVDESGAVVGVRAENKSGSMSIKAKKVIVATGGAGRGEDVMARFIPASKSMEIQRLAGMGVTGDGFALVENAGGKLYDDMVLEGGGLQPDGNAWSKGIDGEIPWRDKLGVDDKGKRFANEGPTKEYVANQMLTYYAMEHGSSAYYWIHDAADAEWTDTLKAGVEAGSVLFGATLAELAGQMGVEAATLQETFDRYQSICESGQDADFGKGAEFLKPYQTEGGFYAVKRTPVCWGTVGGAQTDETCHVLGADGKPVENLFAVGEMSNRALYSDFYIAGDSISLYPTMGRIAAETAVSEMA